MRTAAAYWRGEREEPAAAAHLRHRVGRARTTCAAHLDLPRGGREARPPAPRRRARPVLASPTRSAPAWRCSTPRAGSSSARWRTTSGAGTSRRASSTSAPRTSPRRSCSRPPGTCRTTPTRCSRPCTLEGADYYLKAMNCPMHNLIFRSRGRSYRELPLRLFEFGSVYRYEKSGVVHGLTRVRGLTQDDSHFYCTRGAGARRDQAPAALRAGPARDFGLDDFYLELSTATTPDKFIGAEEQWEEATAHPRARPRPTPGSTWSPTRAARRSTARRSRCRRATPSGAPGRCRPSSSTSTSRAASSWSTRPPTGPGSGR